MAAIDAGNWVKRGEKQGFVVEVGGTWCRVAWLHEGKTEKVTRRTLRRCQPPAALLLEGALDPDLRSERTERGLLKEYLRTYGIQLAARTIHSLDDLEHFEDQLQKMPFLFVHLSCHGASDGDNGPEIVLSPRGTSIPLNDTRSITTFRQHFCGKNVLISACELGKHQAPMRHFKQKTGIATLAVFSRAICDHEAVLFDMFVYHCMIERGWLFKKAIGAAMEAMKCAGSTGGSGHGQSLVRVF